MKLRYTGPIPVVFTNSPVGEVFPGQEFEVPDSAAESLLAHGHVDKVPAKPVKARKELPAAKSAPVAVEAASAAETV
jgi:hypothetical protein